MNKRIKKVSRLWTLMPFAFLIIFFELSPLGNIFAQSFMSSEGVFGFENYITVFTKKVYLTTIWNSIRLTSVSAFIALLIAFAGGIATSTAAPRTKSLFMSILNMTVDFSGLPLAFAFMIILGETGVIRLALQQLGIHILDNFDLYTVKGLYLVYIYFLIPLGTLTILPAFEGIKKEWKEAACLMNASPLQFWMKVGVPVLLPSLADTFALLFADALAAYATIFALVQNYVPVLPTKIDACITGDMIPKPGIGGALSVVMLILVCAVLIITNLIKKRFVKGGKT